VVTNKVAGEDFTCLRANPANVFWNWQSRRLLRWKDGCPIFGKSSMIGGLSLRQALEASAEIAGPVLSKSYNPMRIKRYVNRLEKQFSEVIDVLLPPL
jgi:hypothetical protein